MGLFKGKVKERKQAQLTQTVCRPTVRTEDDHATAMAFKNGSNTFESPTVYCSLCTVIVKHQLNHITVVMIIIMSVCSHTFTYFTLQRESCCHLSSILSFDRRLSYTFTVTVSQYRAAQVLLLDDSTNLLFHGQKIIIFQKPDPKRSVM